MSKVPHLNTSQLPPYGYREEKSPIAHNGVNSKAASNVYVDEDDFIQTQPSITVYSPRAKSRSPRPHNFSDKHTVEKVFSSETSLEHPSQHIRRKNSVNSISSLQQSISASSNEHLNEPSPKEDHEGKPKEPFLNKLKTSYSNFNHKPQKLDPNYISPRNDFEPPKTNSNDLHAYGRKLCDGNKKEKEHSSHWLFRKSAGSIESKETKPDTNTKSATIQTSLDSPRHDEKKKRPSLSYTSSDENNEKKAIRNYGPQTTTGIYSKDNTYQLDPMKEATLIFGQEAEDFNENFMNQWENYSFPNSMYCNVEQVKTCVNNLMRKKFGTNEVKQSTDSEKFGMEVTPRSEDSQSDVILKLIQKDLIRSCSIGKRLHEGMDFVVKYIKTNNKKTFFTEGLYEVYKGLILNSSPRCSDLNPFLLYQDKVDSKSCIKMADIKLSHFPEKGKLEERRIELNNRKNEFLANEEGLKKNKYEHLSKEGAKKIEEELKTIEEDLKKINKKIEEQLKKVNEQISVVIDKVYSVFKIKDQKYDPLPLHKPSSHRVKSDIFDYLNLLNKPSKDFLLELQEKIKLIKESCTELKKNLCVEHVWLEPVDHEFEGLPPPIDKIPLHEIVDYFERHFLNFPILINGVRMEFTDDSDVWLTLFSTMYEAYGCETTEEILQSHIKQFQICNSLEISVIQKYAEMKKLEIEKISKGKYDEQVKEYVALLTTLELELSKLTPSMLKCLCILRLTTVNAWLRGPYYWKLRFENRKSAGNEKYPLDIGYSENLRLDIHIDKHDPEKTIVEQFKCLKLRDINDSKQIYARVPISWKASIVNGSTWKFTLRPLKIKIYDDVRESVINQIETYLRKFNEDESIDNARLANGGIKIESAFNESFQANVQGLKIIPAKTHINTNNC